VKIVGNDANPRRAQLLSDGTKPGRINHRFMPLALKLESEVSNDYFGPGIAIEERVGEEDSQASSGNGVPGRKMSGRDLHVVTQSTLQGGDVLLIANDGVIGAVDDSLLAANLVVLLGKRHHDRSIDRDALQTLKPKVVLTAVGKSLLHFVLELNVVAGGLQLVIETIVFQVQMPAAIIVILFASLLPLCEAELVVGNLPSAREANHIDGSVDEHAADVVCGIEPFDGIACHCAHVVKNKGMGQRIDEILKKSRVVLADRVVDLAIAESAEHLAGVGSKIA